MTALVPENQQQYGSILTIAGENAEQNSKVLKQAVEITHIAFGDANDTYVQPDRNATSLVNEIDRIEVNAVDVQQATPDSVPVLRVEAILPPELGNIVIREFAAVATFNGNNFFHAIGNCARVYVPEPVNNGNMPNPVTLEMFYVITSGEAIVEIDPRVVHASREYVNKTVGIADEKNAQTIIDQNGNDWFIDDGFLVTPKGGNFNIKSGVGYVSGNRIELDFDRIIQVPETPSFVCVDAHREGTSNGEWVTKFNFFVSSEEIDDHTDSKGIKHFFCNLCQVFPDGSVADMRPNPLWNQFKLNAVTSVVRSTHDKLSEVISIRDFGALGGGVDDTKAIQDAYYFALLTGNTVLIPAGEYSYTQLEHPGQVVVVGQGNRRSVLKCIGNEEFSYKFPVKEYPENTTGVVMRDFAIVNETSEHHGVRWVGVSRSMTENLRIEHFPKDGLYLDSPEESEGFASSYYNSHYNIQLYKNGKNIHFGKNGRWESGNSNFFFGGYSNLAIGDACIHMEGDANNVIFSGMTVEALPGKYHLLHEGRGGGALYEACRFENTGAGGVVKVASTAKDTSFIGCLMSGDVTFVNDSPTTTVVGCTGFGHWHISERCKPMHPGGSAIDLEPLPNQTAPLVAAYDLLNNLMFAVGKDGRVSVVADSSKASYQSKGITDNEYRFQVVGSNIFLGNGVDSPVPVLGLAPSGAAKMDKNLWLPKNKYLQLGDYYLWTDLNGKLRIHDREPTDPDVDGFVIGPN